MRRDVVRNDEIPGSVCTESAGALLGQEKIWRGRDDGNQTNGNAKSRACIPDQIIHLLFSSWPGLSRPSTSCGPTGKEDVDARHEAGHDD
jgi:hypothetical protein